MTDGFELGNKLSPTDEYCQVEREIGGKCARLMPCPDHPQRPVTEPKWALVRVPWKDNNHALDPLTVQIMFDFAETQGFDQRRCQLHGIPREFAETQGFERIPREFAETQGFERIPRELWKAIPEGTMLLLQLGSHDEKPEYTNEELLRASEARHAPDLWAKAHYLETPLPGSQAYELYKRIYESHRERLSAIASLLAQIQRKIAEMGVQA